MPSISTRHRGALTLANLAVLTVAAAAEPAIGQFELKDLEAEPGEVEFQSQNAVSFGQPRRKLGEDDPGEYIYDTNSVTRQRHALEIEMSFTRWLRTRVGIEFEKERFEEPAAPAFADAYAPLQLTEVALEGVVILKPVAENGLGFGLLAEFEHPLAPGELNSIIFGPIFGARSGPWSALLNVTLVHHFGSGERTEDGVEKDDKWDAAYAAQLMYAVDATWSIALEAYGTIDRLGATGQLSEGALAFGDHDQHRAGPIVYYRWKTERPGKPAADDDGPTRALLAEASAKPGGDADDGDDGGVTVTLGTGLLLGLNDDTPAATAKVSLEVEF